MATSKGSILALQKLAHMLLKKHSKKLMRICLRQKINVFFYGFPPIKIGLNQ